MKEPRHVNGGLYKRCDCPRRTWPKCKHSWWITVQWRGERRRLSLDQHLARHVDSKTDAEGEAEKIRIAIRAGTFGQPAPRAEMTLRQLVDVYVERYVQVERAARAEAFKGALGTAYRTAIPRPGGEAAPLGDWRLVDIVTDTIERFREVRRGQGLGPVGTNRLLEHLRAMFSWAVRVGYVEASPFKRNGEAVVKFSEEHSRSRRLDADADEEASLLAACAPHLRAVVEAALETGMRRGEILSLQWSQIDGLTVKPSPSGTSWTLAWAPRAEIVLPWTKTKTKRDRRIPVSSRLRAVLDLRRFDPAGQPLPTDAYVFGNAIGQRVRDIGRAWETAVLRSHGHPPKFTATANLTPEGRAALDVIDLHFHDLRREAGSRWLEGGVPIHVVRDWLGHTSIAQTSTYLAGSVKVQHDAMAAFEEHLRAAAAGRKEAGAKADPSGRAVTNCDSEVGKGGRKSPRTAKRRERKPNETGVGRDVAIM